MENPYTPPSAEVQDADPIPAFRGRPLPWEAVPAPEGALGATLKLLFQDLGAAGEGIAASEDLLRPGGWYLLLGLLPALLLAVLGLLHPLRAWWQDALGLPVQPAPEGAALAFGLLAIVFMAPVGAAIGLAVAGLVNHGSLWLVRGTRAGLGLLVTFRSVLYTMGALTLAVTLPLGLLQHLPGRAGQAFQVLTLLASLGTTTYQGAVLAKAHRTETWRGIAAVWIPVLLVVLCCGGAALALWRFGGEEVRQGILQGLRGGR